MSKTEMGGLITLTPGGIIGLLLKGEENLRASTNLRRLDSHEGKKIQN